MRLHSSTDLVRHVKVRAHFRHELQLFLVSVGRVQLPEVFLLHRDPDGREGCQGLLDLLR